MLWVQYFGDNTWGCIGEVRDFTYPFSLRLREILVNTGPGYGLRADAPSHYLNQCWVITVNALDNYPCLWAWRKTNVTLQPHLSRANDLNMWHFHKCVYDIVFLRYFSVNLKKVVKNKILHSDKFKSSHITPALIFMFCISHYKQTIVYSITRKTLANSSQGIPLLA